MSLGIGLAEIQRNFMLYSTSDKLLILLHTHDYNPYKWRCNLRVLKGAARKKHLLRHYS